MVSLRTNAPATPPELASLLADLYQTEAHNIASTVSLSRVPPNLKEWPDEQGDVFAASGQPFKARYGALKLRFLTQQDSGGKGRVLPIGLREMTLTAADVAELRRRIAHPSATPTIPLRAVPEEETDELF